MSDAGCTVEREVFIAAPPETVFQFLIDPELMPQWIGIEHDIDPRPGGSFRVEIRAGNVARGAYMEVTPFRRVAFTWGWDSSDPALGLEVLPPGASLVEIELEPIEGGTLLRLRHSRLPDGLSAIHRDRWSLYLAQLASAVPRFAQRSVSQSSRSGAPDRRSSVQREE
jgi:uncharacterized protein YndB with AHSA1/START domain